MEVNVPKILKECKGLDYVILRNSNNFHNYPIGSDIDIITRDISSVVVAIIRGLGDYIPNGYVVEKKISNEHTHIDLIKDDTLIVRFDVINLIVLNPTSIVDFLLSNRVEEDNMMFENKVGDVFARLLEYVINPTKTKHLDFIKDKYKI